MAIHLIPLPQEIGPNCSEKAAKSTTFWSKGNDVHSHILNFKVFNAFIGVKRCQKFKNLVTQTLQVFFVDILIAEVKGHIDIHFAPFAATENCIFRK